jgi:hypothetical protein
MILFKVLSKKFVKDSALQFQNFHVNYPKFHPQDYQRLGYHKFYARWVPKNAHGCMQNAGNDFGFDFLEQYHKDGDEFGNHIA